MSYTIEELETALLNAEEAGDAEAATLLANEINTAMNQPNTATDILTKPKTMFEQLTAPNKPEFNLDDAVSRVGTSAALGAGIGAILPNPATATLGAVSGAGGAIAGELGRAMGVSDLTRTGMEVVGSLGVEAVPMAASFLRTRLTAAAPTMGMGTGRVGISPVSNEVVSDRVAQHALRQTQLKLFGKEAFDLKIKPENFMNTQNKLSQEILGDVAVSDKTVSSVLRERLYDTMKQGKSSGSLYDEVTPAQFDNFRIQTAPEQTKQVLVKDVFANSPEYKTLLQDVSLLAKTPKQADAGARRDLVKIIKNELDDSVEDSSERLIGLIQDGGIFEVAKKGADAETKTLISEPMRKALKNRFDEYLERTVGAKQYQQLKNVEREEFIAKAKDYIPELLNNAWRMGTPEYRSVINTVKTSPETRSEFAKALNQHLGSLDNTRAIKNELRRLSPGLKEAKVLDSDAIRKLYNTAGEFDKKFSNQKAVTQIKSLISTALTGAIATESAGGFTKINPFKVLSP